MTLLSHLISIALLAPPSPSLVAGGSGTALPAVRALAAAYQADNPSFTLHVAESIGSTGGVLAVRDGAMQLGLVSRPLRVGEGDGLCAIPFAEDLIVIATSPDVQVSSLSTAQLLQIYRAELTVWPGSQPPLPIHPLQREAGDSGTQIMTTHIVGLGEILQKALDQSWWRVLFHDAEMQQALLQSKGAIGIFDLGAIRAQKLPLRPLVLDGHEPTLESYEAAHYPYASKLSFITKAGTPRPPELTAFFAFVRSPRGMAVLRNAGYAPPSSTVETCH